MSEVAPARLDEVLPRWNVSKIHRLEVAAPPDVVFAAVESYEPGDSLVTSILMTLRGYGLRRARVERGRGLAASLTRFGFVPLGGRPGREVVYGIVGRFWMPSGGLCRVSPEEFLAFERDGYAKGAWNVSVAPAPAEGSSLLTTETRVRCFGGAARRRFRLYWSVVEPFSGLIRSAMLRSIGARATRPTRSGGR